MNTELIRQLVESGASREDIIKAHLEDMAKNDAAFAERYHLECKTMDKCLHYINEEARKRAKDNVAAINGWEVLNWAVHYYQEEMPDDKPKEVEQPKTHTFVPPTPKPSAQKAQPKKKKCEFVQLDLFDNL